MANSLKVFVITNEQMTTYRKRKYKNKTSNLTHLTQPFELLPLAKYFYTKPICFECFHVNLISSFEINSFHSLREKVGNWNRVNYVKFFYGLQKT